MVVSCWTLCLVKRSKARLGGSAPNHLRGVQGVRWAVLDMSGPYQVAYNQVLPHARQVADPFHCKRKAPLTDANLLMAAHLSGEGAKAGQKDADRHLQTHPQQVAAPNPTTREPTPRRTPDSAARVFRQ